MDFFYKPWPGIIGDTIPFYSQGRHHVFFLRDYRDRDDRGIGGPWHHVSTTDFVNFEDHGEPLSKGAMDEQDHTVATGCVFTDPSGLHHIFYTGINPYLKRPDSHEQAILHATSSDLIHWTKHPSQVWYADEERYERHDWRDPYVFVNPQTGKYNMVLAAREKNVPVHRAGCTALLVSDDLENWSSEGEFYAPRRYHGHECPDWFKMGDWYYLVFSEYSTHTATRYVMSREPGGPWHAPDNNQFDNRAFYAAKTSSDGKRRFIYGWNPTKWGDSDQGEWQWGGCLVIHEIIQQADGRLTVRMPIEQRNAFGISQPLQLDALEAGWARSGDGYHGNASNGLATAVSSRMPATYWLEAEITFQTEEGRAGVLLRGDESGDTAYFLRLDMANQRLEFGKFGGHRSWYVDHMPELDRPVAIGKGKPIRLVVVVDGSALTAYVDDTVALCARMYSNPRGRCGLFADGADVEVTSFEWAERVGA